MGTAIIRRQSSTVHWAYTAMALTMALTACSARLKSSIKDCEARANRQSPAQLREPGNDPISYMQRCMNARGYRLNLFKTSCQIGLDSQHDSGCYSAIKK